MIALKYTTYNTPIAVDIAIVLNSVYNALNNIRNRAAMLVIDALAIIPVSLLGLVLLVLTKRLKEYYSEEIKLTSDNYLNLRNEYDSIDEFISKLNTYRMLSVTEAFYFRPSSIAMKYHVEALELRKEKIDKALSAISMDNVKNSTFKAVSESSLWNNRPKSADYLFK